MRFSFNAAFLASVLGAGTAAGQHTHTNPEGTAGSGAIMSDADARAMAAHMQMTPLRPATGGDSSRAAAIVAELRVAIERGEPTWQTSSTGPMSMPSSREAVATRARRSPARRRDSTR